MTKSLSFLLTTVASVALLAACSSTDPAHEGAAAGECSDGADNDGDGLFDCGDPDCFCAPACAAGFDGGPGMDAAPGLDAGPGGDSGPPVSEFECCINGVGYRCANEAAFTQCIGFDIDGCLERCAPGDFGCIDGCFSVLDVSDADPSACVQDDTATCEPTGGSCDAGSACDTDSDCTSNNCSGGFCYDNVVGCRCDTDSDCTSNNCTGGMCAGNAVGDRCDTDSDCTSNNCTGGMCAGNGLCDPCDTDSDCTSNNCSRGRCQGG